MTRRGEWGDMTGVWHYQVHPHKAAACQGMIEYNGVYVCGECGMGVSVEAHPALYTGLFQNRYPNGNYTDHPNFNQEIFDEGLIELEEFKNGTTTN